MNRHPLVGLFAALFGHDESSPAGSATAARPASRFSSTPVRNAYQPPPIALQDGDADLFNVAQRPIPIY